MSPVECHLYLGVDAIECECRGRGQGLTPTALRIAFQAGNIEAAALALEATAKQLATVGRVKRVDVQVAGRWLRWLNLPWSTALLDPVSSQETCRQQVLLNQGALEPLTFAIGAAPYGRERVAAGLPEALLMALRGLADQTELSVAPAAAAALSTLSTEAPARPCGLFVCETGVLTCLLISNGILCRAYQQASPDNGVTGLSSVWQRLQLRDETLVGCKQVYVLDLTAKGGVQDTLPAPFQYLPLKDSRLRWSSSETAVLNFLPPPRPWKGWRGAAAAAGVVLMIATGGHWWRVQQTFNQAQQQLAVVSVTAAGTHITPVAVTAKNSRELQIQIKGVNEAVRQLSAPVGRILQSLKPVPASGIALLQLHFKAGQAHQLSIEGLAPNAAAMTAYVATLGAKPVFTSAWLARHEQVGEDSDGGYRFTIEASWQE